MYCPNVVKTWGLPKSEFTSTSFENEIDDAKLVEGVEEEPVPVAEFATILVLLLMAEEDEFEVEGIDRPASE